MINKKTPLEDCIDSIGNGVEFFTKNNNGKTYHVIINNHNSMIWELLDIVGGNPIFIETEELNEWVFMGYVFNEGLEKEMEIQL